MGCECYPRSKGLKYACMVIWDIVTLIIVWAVLVIFTYNTVKPDWKPIPCNDMSIRNPYRPNTVTVPVLFAFAMAPNVVLILLIPCLQRYVTPETDEEVSDKNKEVKQGALWVYKYLMLYFIGFGILGSINEIAKILVGRPRPSFWDFCKPNVNCTGNPARLVAIDVYTDCNNNVTSLHSLRDFRMSFFSGHSMVAFYGAVFFTITIQRFWNAKWIWGNVRLIFQFCMLATAMFICMSRLLDNRHFRSDVCTGIGTGIAGALFIIYCYPHLSSYLEEEVDSGDTGA